jgi:Ca2+-binding RTX toxin-like protein
VENLTASQSTGNSYSLTGNTLNNTITGSDGMDMSYMIDVMTAVDYGAPDALWMAGSYIFYDYPSAAPSVTSTAFSATYGDGTQVSLVGSSLNRTTAGSMTITSGKVIAPTGDTFTFTGSITQPLVSDGMGGLMPGEPTGNVTKGSWTSADGNTMIRETGTFASAPTTAGKMVETITEYFVSVKNPETGLTSTLTIKGNITDTQTFTKVSDGMGGYYWDWENATTTYSGSFTSLVLNDGAGNTQSWTGNVPFTEALSNLMDMEGPSALFNAIGMSFVVGGNDTLNGGAGDDTLAPGLGTNTVDGGVGTDTLTLTGLQEDYVFSRPTATTVTIRNITTGITEVHTVSNVEKVRFGDDSVRDLTIGDLLANTASGFDDGYIGGEADDNFDGLAGNDTINGNGGNDTLAGGLGNDLIDGGMGDDVMTGGLGDDTYVVDSEDDIITELATGGTDTVKTDLAFYGLEDLPQVENLTYTGTTDFMGLGNALANTITGGIGNDLLWGGEGVAIDTLIGGAGNDFLEGGGGADKMTGGLGDDTYDVDNAADVVTELTGVGSGNDTIYTSLKTFTLATTALANVENLTASQSTGNSYSLTGNTLNNTITGSDGMDFAAPGFGLASLLGQHAGLYAAAPSLIQEYVFYPPAGYSASPVVSATAFNATYTDGTRVQLAGSGFTTTGNHNTTLTSGTVTKALEYGGQEIYSFKGSIVQPVGADGAMSAPPTGKVTEATWTQGALDLSYFTKIVKVGSFDLSAQSSGVNVGKHVFNMTSIVVTRKDEANTETLTLTGNATLVVDSLGNETYSGSFTSLKLDDGLGNVSTWTGTLAYSKVVEDAIFNHNADESTLFNVFPTTSRLGGNDTLNGGAGDDKLYGGLGNDTLTGGVGADQFYIDSALNATSNVDKFTDFAAAIDKFMLDSDIFAGLVGNTENDGTLTTGAFGSWVTGASNAIISYNQSNGMLYYDADGNGISSSAQSFAQITSATKPALAATDFVLYGTS